MSFLVAFAHFPAYEGAEFGLDLPEGVPELADDFTTFGGGDGAPDEESFVGGLHSAVVLLRCRGGEAGNLAAIYRGVRIEDGTRTESLGPDHDAGVDVADAELRKDGLHVHAPKLQGEQR